MAKNVSIAEILASRSIPTDSPQSRVPEPEKPAAGTPAEGRSREENLPAGKPEETAKERPAEKPADVADVTKVFRIETIPAEEETSAQAEGPERQVSLQEVLASHDVKTAEPVPAETEEITEEVSEEEAVYDIVSDPAETSEAAEESGEAPAEDVSAEAYAEPYAPAFSDIFEEYQVDPEEVSAPVRQDVPAFEEVFEEYDLESVRSEREKKEFMRRVPKMQTENQPEASADVDQISEKLSGKLKESLEDGLGHSARGYMEQPEEAAPNTDPAAAKKTEQEVYLASLPLRERSRLEREAARKKPARYSAAAAKREQSADGYEDAGSVRAKRAEREEEEKKPVSALVRELLVIAAIFLVCLIIVPNYIIQRTIVNGDSMNESLHDGDQLMVDKLTHHFKDYERFDVVVFYPFGKDKSDEYYIKRIIGLPGETIQITGDTIYIDGKVLEENYGKEPMTYAGIAAEPVTLGEDEYFLLGDHREVSFDSRYDQVGVVGKKQIAGKAVVRIWPMSDFGSLD